MKRSFVLSLALICASSFLPKSAQSAVPQLINYQGFLADAVGDPVVDGKHNIGFIIWNDPAATGAINEKWNSGPQIVTTTNGLFEYAFGSNVRLPDNLFKDTILYLGITVDTDPEISPRTRLVSAGYSYHALRADTAAISATVFDNSITSVKIVDGSISSADLGANSVTGAAIAADAVGASEIVTGAVASAEVLNNSLTASDLAANSVGSSEIGAGAVGTSEVADNSLTAADLATNSVGASEIGAGAVGTSEVADNSLTASDLAANSVGSSEIAPSAVGTSEILDNSILDADILDESGVAINNGSGIGTSVSISSSWKTIKSITIAQPASGYVVCIGTGHVDYDVTTYTGDILMGWSGLSPGTPQYYNRVSLDAGIGTTTYIPITTMFTFGVVGVLSPSTFYLRARASSAVTGAEVDIIVGSAVVMYFPTIY